MTFHRYVALGDSFTEGVGDPDPSRPNGLRGWADRVAEVLATQTDDFGYANLAIRGRKLAPIVAEQVDAAIALEPDLITIHGGGNDVLRPRVDLDALAATYDDAIGRLSATGARVVMFTSSTRAAGDLRSRARADGDLQRVGARDRRPPRRDPRRHVADARRRDRRRHGHRPDAPQLLGHTHIARAVLEAIGVEHALAPVVLDPLPVLPRREQWAANAQWTREFLVPWVHRRVTGRSSGDTVSAKRPGLSSVTRASGSIRRAVHGRHADVAQLVERDLPKVDVASSNLVIRSNSSGAQSATLCPPSMSRVRISSSAPTSPVAVASPGIR